MVAVMAGWYGGRPGRPVRRRTVLVRTAIGGLAFVACLALGFWLGGGQWRSSWWVLYAALAVVLATYLEYRRQRRWAQAHNDGLAWELVAGKAGTVTEPEHQHQHSASQHQDVDPRADPTEHWEERYAGQGPIWSGRVNAQLSAVAAALPPGRALDLGSGEGADAIWLAEHDWQVTGVDISATALSRAAQAAAERGIASDRIDWVEADLATWEPTGQYELVAASFLHSRLEFPRTAVLRRAAAAVTPGGHLLVISHAAPPPWAEGLDEHTHHFLTPQQEVEELDLPSHWHTVLAEERTRPATGPDGEQAELTDAVVLLRRS